jgi:hypothetical protein
MVIAPVVAAAAPAVVSSATNDEGLINKLFKIGMLIGFLALAGISIVILSFIIEIADVVGAAFNVIGTAARALTILPGGLGWIATAFTYVSSAFVFGPRR